MLFLAKKLGDITVEEVVIFAMFALIIASIVAYILKKTVEKENEGKPINGKVATLIDVQNQNALYAWGIFETEDGERVRVTLEVNEGFVVGDKGYLKWQGANLIAFERGKDENDIRQEIERKRAIDASKMWRCRFCDTVNMNHWERCNNGSAAIIAAEKGKIQNNNLKFIK